MKTLLLLRHAKSSWKDVTVSDHDRPLNGRGRRATALVREFLKKRDFVPEFVLTSSALRTRQTVEILFEGAARVPDICVDDALYLASAETLLERISILEESRQLVLVVSHNPGTEELFSRLTGIRERFPTASIANIGLDITSWSEAGDTKGELRWFVTPRQLEALE